MNFKDILAALEKGVEFASEAANLIPGLGTVVGGAAGTIEFITKAVAAATDLVEHVQQQIADGYIVADATDQNKVRDMAQKLHEANDILADYIDKS